MKITISKILNRTDLAESGSHGGLVVTKNAQKSLTDFFEVAGQEQNFQDKDDTEVFPIHYVDYTSNGTTPNDRVTPIGRYASKHDLKPGDNLIFQKVENVGAKQYFIEYARKLNSAYFVGKSKEKVEVLDYNQFTDIMIKNVTSGKIQRTSPTTCEMQAKYQGLIGKLMISQNADNFEMYFNGEHIEENNKYFELDTLTNPFELRKTDTWKIEIDIDAENEELNDDAEHELLAGLANQEISTDTDTYVPQPEDKKPGHNVGGRTVPNRDKDTANKALTRAGYLCEFDNAHGLFLRKKQPINYTEPHHLIPLKYDDLFEKSLDVQANIVSLCSHCHNLIHYGADAEVVIRKLWEDRHQEIIDAGIGTMKNGTDLTVEILLGFYHIK